MRRSGVRTTAAIGTILAGLLAVLVPVTSASAAPTPITVWATEATAPVLQQQFPKGFDGRPVVVVAKSAATLVDELAAVAPEAAPDVIEIPHTRVGALAASQTIVPVSVGPKIAARFAPQVWRGFTPNDVTYGMPVTVSNVALITNAALVPTQPTSFDALATAATTLVKEKKAKIPFAIGQSPLGDARITYPLFSALGGYILGTSDSGGVDITDIGFANPTFMSQTPKIQEWNDTRLVRSIITPERARDSFVKGRTPFWIAPASELPTIMGLTFSYRITAVPPVVVGRDAAPLLDMTGFAMTRFAELHGIAEDTSSFVSSGLSRKGTQAAIATAAKLVPASVPAQQAMATTGEAARLRAFLQAGAKGVAAPSVPQQDQLLSLLGTAWLQTTSGAEAAKPKPTFKGIQAQAKELMGLF